MGKFGKLHLQAKIRTNIKLRMAAQQNAIFLKNVLTELEIKFERATESKKYGARYNLALRMHCVLHTLVLFRDYAMEKLAECRELEYKLSLHGN